MTLDERREDQLRPGDVLTVRDVCALLKMHHKTVQRHAKEGTIPAKRIGGEWRFVRSEIEAWLRDGNRHEDQEAF